MRYGEVALYARSLRAVSDPRRRKSIHEAVSALVECFEQGVRPPVGLGLKKLRPPLWEIRSSLRDRIVFGWNKDVVTFLVAGDHEDIKRLLKRV